MTRLHPLLVGSASALALGISGASPAAAKTAACATAGSTVAATETVRVSVVRKRSLQRYYTCALPDGRRHLTTRYEAPNTGPTVPMRFAAAGRWVALLTSECGAAVNCGTVMTIFNGRTRRQERETTVTGLGTSLAISPSTGYWTQGGTARSTPLTSQPDS